jgi:2-(1,2-epoxy-1,2-dihydrophenyl)acetyl-CoA isomerase
VTAPRKLGDITVDVHDGVAELTLDARGENALSAATATALTAFLAAAPGEAGIRALLITGTGRRFCVGADVRGDAGEPPRRPIDHRFAYQAYSRLFDALWQVELPVVTAVNGTVAGAGWLLALLGDIVVADEDARWTHVFARRGFLPHAGDPYYLARVIPFRRIMEISLLSDPVPSTTLERWSVINRAVPSEELMPVARDLASRLADGATRTLGVAKQLYRRSLDSSPLVAAADERASVALISTTLDRAEGVASFREGRDARFTGE